MNYPPDDSYWARRLRDIQRSYVPRWSPPAPKPKLKPWRVVEDDLYRDTRQTWECDSEIDAFLMALSLVWSLREEGYEPAPNTDGGPWLLVNGDFETRIVRVERAL